MQTSIYLLAIISCVASLPTNFSKGTPAEFDLSKLTPKGVYVQTNSAKNGSSGSKIVGGVEVVPNSVPYQAALIIDGTGMCGGSLISTIRVLTAAHCTFRASFVQVILGAHEFNTNEPTQVRITSTNVITHEDYALLTNDVSVIFLPSAVDLNSAIWSIPLAPANSGTFAGSRAFLSGWGRSSDGSSVPSSVLRGVELSIITNHECSLSYSNLILSSNLCTSGKGNVGACSGDSGGALVVDGVQVGVTSFGSAVCEDQNPTAFARVSSFRTWISENAGV